MIKILTAIGNPKLNFALKSYNEFEIIGKDIQYKDGIIEILEISPEINYVIISEMLDGQISLENLIDKIIEFNRKIKIIVILNEKNKLVEDNLLKKGIFDILYNNTDLIDIINLLKAKNIEYLNKELREEIENLKKIIIKKNKIKSKKICQKNNDYNKNKRCKTIGIVGNNGIGKSTFSFFWAKCISEKNKVLIIDYNLINIDNFYNYDKNNNSINGGMNGEIRISNNINIIKDCSYLDENLKEKYDYILIDSYLDKKINENKSIWEFCDCIFFLTKLNNLEIVKSKKLINDMCKNLKINYKKINLILYKYKNIDLLFFNKITLKNIFNNVQILGKIKYYHLINIYLNCKFNNLFINTLLKKECLKIINKLEKKE